MSNAPKIVRVDDRIVSVGDVLIETVDARPGWAVFTGCDGEEPHFHAFFATRADAEQYLKFCDADPDSDAYLCDPDIAPAVADIIAANHFDYAEGAAAVVEAAHLTVHEAEDFRAEASAPFTRPAQEKP